MLKLSALSGSVLLCLYMTIGHVYTNNVLFHPFSRVFGFRPKGCFSVVMQTFAGTNTISYPVGVFDIHGNLLGNATAAAAYISLWNNDTADARVGSLALGRDSMHFNLTLNAGQILLPGVTGLRYYQVDLPWSQFDAVRWFNGAYIDFGDGVGIRMPANESDTPAIHPPNTVYYPTGDNVYDSTNVPTFYYVHNYVDTSLKTITCYHNDAAENSDFDNDLAPATSLTKLRNFRGNLPAHTISIGGSCYQQSGMTSVQNITNWSSISSVQYFRMNNGDNGVSPCEHIGYAQDFMANNKGLKSILTQWSNAHIFGTYDSSFRLSRLKTNWNTYFIQLQSIAIDEHDWNHEDLSALVNLNAFSIVPWTQNGTISSSDPFVPLSTGEIDSIFIQISAGAGQHVSNGTVAIWTGGGTRSSASTSAMDQLISKGWTIYMDGVVQVSQ